MPTWLIIGIGLWLFVAFCAVCLCKAAARGDRQLGYTPPSPVADEVERWLQARERTYERQGIQHLGKTQVGIDPR